MNRSFEGFANQELLVATHALVRHVRSVEAELLRHLGEVDARRLFLGEACSSMFVYCVRVLHFSEAAAYKRIRAARAARRHPELLCALRQEELPVTAVSLLAAQLTSECSEELIRAARHTRQRKRSSGCWPIASRSQILRNACVGFLRPCLWGMLQWLRYRITSRAQP